MTLLDLECKRRVSIAFYSSWIQVIKLASAVMILVGRFGALVVVGCGINICKVTAEKDRYRFER